MNLDAVLIFTGTMYFLARGFNRRSAGPDGAGRHGPERLDVVYFAARPGVAVVLACLALAALDPRLRGRWLLWGALALPLGYLVGGGPEDRGLHQGTSSASSPTKSEVTGWLTGAIPTAFLADRRPVQADGHLGALLHLAARLRHSRRASTTTTVAGPSSTGCRPRSSSPALSPLDGQAAATGGCACSRSGSGARRSRLSMLSDVTPAGHRVLPALRAGGPARRRRARPAAGQLGVLRTDRPAGGSWSSRRSSWPASMVHEAAYYFTDFGRRDSRPVRGQAGPLRDLTQPTGSPRPDRARPVAGRDAAPLARQPVPVGERHRAAG